MFSENDQCVARFGSNHPTSSQNHGALSRSEEFCRLLNCHGITLSSIESSMCRWNRQNYFSIFRLEILRNVQEHGAWTSFAHCVERLMQDLGQLVYSAGLPPSFYYWLGHPRKICAMWPIDLLEDPTIHHVGVHTSGQDQLRNRVGNAVGIPVRG